MCNVQSPNTRALIIEVLENGKVSLPPFIHNPEATLTIEELKKCRDYLDLIIANPDNFHVVGDGVPRPIHCRKCSADLKKLTGAEVLRGICNNCERAKILEQVNKPIGNYSEKIKNISPWTDDDVKAIGEAFAPVVNVGVEDRPLLSEDGLCMALDCFNPREPIRRYCDVHSPYVGIDKEYYKPMEEISINGDDNKAYNGPAPDDLGFDDKICTGCNKRLNKIKLPTAWERGTCVNC